MQQFACDSAVNATLHQNMPVYEPLLRNKIDIKPLLCSPKDFFQMPLKAGEEINLEYNPNAETQHQDESFWALTGNLTSSHQ